MNVTTIINGQLVLALVGTQYEECVVEEVIWGDPKQVWDDNSFRLGGSNSTYRTEYPEGVVKLHKANFSTDSKPTSFWLSAQSIRGVIQPRNCAADVEHKMLKSAGHIYCWHCGVLL